MKPKSEYNNEKTQSHNTDQSTVSDYFLLLLLFRGWGWGMMKLWPSPNWAIFGNFLKLP